MKQIYETTVIDTPTGLSASFLSIPARSFDDPGVLFDVETITAILQLRLMAKLPPFALHGAFVDIFQNNAEVKIESHRRPRPSAAGTLDDFADYLSYVDFIPFEGSPLETIALATLLARAAKQHPGAAIGAFVAYQMSTDPHSFVVILTTTAGLIIGGAADTVRSVFNDEGRRLLRDLMKHRGKRDQQPKRGRRPKPE